MPHGLKVVMIYITKQPPFGSGTLERFIRAPFLLLRRQKSKTAKYYRSERTFGSFVRRVSVSPHTLYIRCRHANPHPGKRARRDENRHAARHPMAGPHLLLCSWSSAMQNAGFIASPWLGILKSYEVRAAKASFSGGHAWASRDLSEP